MAQFKSTLFTGNVAITGNITIAGDIIAKAATQAVAGLMSAADKIKLDGIQAQLDGKAPSSHTHSEYVDLSNAQTISGNKTFTGKYIFSATGTYDNPSVQKFVVGDNSSAFVIGSDGLQTFTSTNSSTAKIMYLNYYGGDVIIGKTSGTQTINLQGTIKENGTALSDKYASKSVATTSANGLMSSSDKTKLNSLYNQPDMQTQDFVELTVSDELDFDFDYGCREYIIVIESAGGKVYIDGGYYSGTNTSSTAIIKMSMVDGMIYAGIIATDEGNSGIIVVSGTEIRLTSQDSSDIAISVMGY